MASRSLLRLFQIVSLPCGMLHGVDSWVSAGVFPRYRNIHEHCFRDRKTGSRAPLRVYSRRRWLHGEPNRKLLCDFESKPRQLHQNKNVLSKDGGVTRDVFGETCEQWKLSRHRLQECEDQPCKKKLSAHLAMHTVKDLLVAFALLQAFTHSSTNLLVANPCLLGSSCCKICEGGPHDGRNYRLSGEVRDISATKRT